VITFSVMAVTKALEIAYFLPICANYGIAEVCGATDEAKIEAPQMLA
jgi:hypothetical protein